MSKHSLAEKQTQTEIGPEAARGMFWVFITTLGGRSSSLLSQVALGYLIARSEYGLFSIAFSLAQLGRIVQGAGVERWLVRQRESYDQLAAPFNWVVMSLSLFAGLVLAAVAPMAAWFYQASDVAWLVWIIAASMPLFGASKVLQAKLQIDQNYKGVALITSGTEISRHFLAVGFAWFGFGAYSFALPLLISPLFQWIAYYRTLGLWPKSNYRAKQLWPKFIRDYKWILITSIALGIVLQGNALVAGRFLSLDEVGVFGFAFQLTMAVVFSFGSGINTVLMPSFTRLTNDPSLQRSGFFRSVRLFTTLIIPICCLNALVAQHVVPLIWGDKWIDSIPIIFILSFAIPFLLCSSVNSALLESQGAWRLNGLLSVVRAIGTLISAWIGVLVGGILGLAIASLLCQAFFCFIQGGIVSRRLCSRPHEFLLPFIVPSLLSLSAMILCQQVIRLTQLQSHLTQLSFVVVIFPLSVLTLTMIFSRRRFWELWAVLNREASQA